LTSGPRDILSATRGHFDPLTSSGNVLNNNVLTERPRTGETEETFSNEEESDDETKIEDDSLNLGSGEAKIESEHARAQSAGDPDLPLGKFYYDESKKVDAECNHPGCRNTWKIWAQNKSTNLLCPQMHGPLAKAALTREKQKAIRKREAEASSKSRKQVPCPDCGRPQDFAILCSDCQATLLRSLAKTEPAEDSSAEKIDSDPGKDHANIGGWAGVLAGAA